MERGVGRGRGRPLRKQLGSMRAVKAASEQELAAVSGVSRRDAAVIRRFFDALDGETEAADEATGG